MPLWLLSPTLWKAVGAAVLVAALTWGGFYVKGKFDDAAAVPALQAKVKALSGQIATNDARADKAAIDLVQAYAKRDQAIADFSVWRGQKAQLFSSIREMSVHAPASTNAVCLPSDAERKLWNDTITKLTADTGAGPSGDGSEVPAGTGRVY